MSDDFDDVFDSDDIDDVKVEFDDNDFDGAGSFRVNFSDQEAKAAPRELLPTGDYVVRVTDVTRQLVSKGENINKPMFNFEYTVESGEYEGRKLYDLVCLWDGALYSVSQMLKAVGFKHLIDEGRIPGAEWWTADGGRRLCAVARKFNERTVTNKKTGAKFDRPAETKVLGYKRPEEATNTPTATKKVAGRPKAESLLA